MANTLYLFPVDFYKKLSPEYCQALEKLETDIFDILSTKKASLIDAFSEKYMMPSKLWDLRMSLATEVEKKELLKRALNDFYYTEEATNEWHLPISYCLLSPRSDFLSPYLLNTHQSVKNFENELTYPHNKLRQIFMKYSRHSFTFPSTKGIKTFEKMEAFHQQLTKALVEEDDEKWLECLKDISDFGILMHNFEYRIGQDLTNKNLWILYIRYLNEIPEANIALPRVLKAYCQFFVDDDEMKQKLNKTLKYIDLKLLVLKPKEKLLKPESKKCSCEELKRIIAMSLPPARQRFSIPSQLIDHVLKNSPHATLKLQKSCKHFIKATPAPICYQLALLLYFPHVSPFIDDSYVLNTYEVAVPEIPKLWVAGSLSINFPQQNTLSTWISNRIVKCTAKHIFLYNQIITKKEFEFLIDHKGVEELKLDSVKILNNEQHPLAVDEILSMLPKLRIFEANNIFIDNLRFLVELKFQNKFIKFSLWGQLKHFLTVEDVCSFISRNAGPCAFIEFNFDFSLGKDEIRAHEAKVQEYLKTWKPLIDKPKYSSLLPSTWGDPNFVWGQP